MPDNVAAAEITKTTTTTSIPVNPLLDSKNVTEVGALVLLFGGISALINKWFDNKAKAREEKHTVEHERLNDKLSVFKHDLKDAEQKIGALEHFRVDDVNRIVKVEGELKAINDSQVRIENTLDRMAASQKDARTELVDAIRRLQDKTDKNPSK